MLPVLTVLIAVGIALIAVIVHQAPSQRSRLVHIIGGALLIAVILRELPFVQIYPLADLAKRELMLIAEAAVVLLVMTFQNPRPSTHARRFVMTCAVIICGLQLVLLPAVPRYPDGSLYLSEHANQSIAAMIYHALYLVGIIVMGIVVIVACIPPSFSRRTPWAARASTTFLLIASLAAAVYAITSCLNLTHPGLVIDRGTRRALLLTTISALFASLAIGAARRFKLIVQDTISVRIATRAVLPVWEAAVRLHPGVVLPPDPEEPLTPRGQLIRFTVETHDALRLARDKGQNLSAEHVTTGRLSRTILRLISPADDPLMLSVFEILELRTNVARGDSRHTVSS